MNGRQEAEPAAPDTRGLKPRAAAADLGCTRGLLRRFLSCLCVTAALFLAAGCKKQSASADTEEFTRLSNLGKSQLEAGDGAKAATYFQQALALNPTLPEARLNLANAYLLAGQPGPVLEHAQQVLQGDRTSAAAYYLMGCAYLRQGKAEEALQALDQSYKLDSKVTALNFQLALAHERLGHLEEAMAQLKTVIEFEPEHPAAHYRLSQLLLRTGHQAEADQELKAHQALLAKHPNGPNDLWVFEKCKHTLAKLSVKPEEPAAQGIKVTFADATAALLPNAAASAYAGPLAIIDLAHDGHNSLFVRDGDGFRLLLNTGGKLVGQEPLLPGLNGASYRAALVGDLQNDQVDDVVALSDKGCQVFKFTTNGVMSDISRSAGFAGVPALDGLLLDFDYTGKLGFIVLQPDGKGVRAFRNLSSTFAMYFSENNVTSGLPAALPGGQHLVLEDWNNDELMDIAITRDQQPPLLFVRERGAGFTMTNAPAGMPAASVLATADLNNDSFPDAIAAERDQISIHFGGGKPAVHLPLGGFSVRGLHLIDYDNDGWLDVLATGNGVRAWRNLGSGGFREVTKELGLDRLPPGAVQFLAAGDLDGDCDTDLAVAIEGAGLRLLRNEGGNANHQLKLRLMGRRSNASGLGVRFETTAGGLRSWRTVKQLPIELGMAGHTQVDSVAVRWSDGFLNNDEIKLEPCAVVTLEELERATGSCPFLYSWDGRGFRFVTDLLGAAPLGLPVADAQFIDADPREYVRLGDEQAFPARDGRRLLQITEELREVLYLDEAKLVVVDHPPGTEVHTTGKLLPGKPFSPPAIVTLHRRQPLLRAVNHAGADVTADLQEIDGRMVSPTGLRSRQLRGLAEPHSVTLDFGSLATERPLVLALTGWLRFGGGMANVGAAHTPGLPFPFPVLEVESPEGRWNPVDVVVGAPAGKTKTILVDLDGKLPRGSRRLRLSAAFELHWDRLALFEKRDNTETRISRVTPTATDLHWRGYSEFEPWPWFLPVTPSYANPRDTAGWTTTPSGWCTRYGSVDPLLKDEDNALVLLNGGDELTLQFAEAALPAKPAGAVRDFFLYTVGWDKDADFHCTLGFQVEPLPWHGMDGQRYGKEPRPAFANDEWMRRFNTRWVGPQTLVRRGRAQ